MCLFLVLLVPEEREGACLSHSGQMGSCPVVPGTWAQCDQAAPSAREQHPVSMWLPSRGMGLSLLRMLVKLEGVLCSRAAQVPPAAAFIAWLQRSRCFRELLLSAGWAKGW